MGIREKPRQAGSGRRFRQRELDDSTGAPMTRDEVLKVLRAHKATLSQRFGVTDLVLFGSVARDQASTEMKVAHKCQITGW